MNIQNDHWYLNELESLINDFLINNDVADDVGYLPVNIEKLMSEAAFNVLRTVKDVNDYMEKEKPFS